MMYAFAARKYLSAPTGVLTPLRNFFSLPGAMSQNLASIAFTIAEVTTIKGALQTIRTTIGDRAVSLSPAERSSLLKMGDKTRVFCAQAVTGLEQNAASLPPVLDIPELVQDLADYNALEAVFAEYEAVGELLDDTLKALASDIMTNSIIGVTFLKALNKLNPGLDTLLSSLKSVRRRPAAPATQKTTK